VGYFWITLTAMFCLYAGIYRVALDLHRRSEEKRKKLSMSLSTMAQQTIGQLGTAAIMMARNTKLDACLISAMPSAMQTISGNGNVLDNFNEERISSNRQSGKGNQIGGGGRVTSLEKGRQTDGDDDTSSSCMSTPESKKKSTSNKTHRDKETEGRKKSLLMNNQDLRMLMPRTPKQYLQLPVSTSLVDKGVKSLVSHRDLSINGSSLTPCFASEIRGGSNSPPIKSREFKTSGGVNFEIVISPNTLNSDSETIAIVLDATDCISKLNIIGSEKSELETGHEPETNSRIPILNVVNFDEHIENGISVDYSDAAKNIVDEGEEVKTNDSVAQTTAKEQTSGERYTLCIQCQDSTSFRGDYFPNQLDTVDINNSNTGSRNTSNKELNRSAKCQEAEDIRVEFVRPPDRVELIRPPDQDISCLLPHSSPPTSSECKIQSLVTDSESKINEALIRDTGSSCEVLQVEGLSAFKVSTMDCVSSRFLPKSSIENRLFTETSHPTGLYPTGLYFTGLYPTGANPTDTGPVVSTVDCSNPLPGPGCCDWLSDPEWKTPEFVDCRPQQSSLSHTGSDLHSDQIWVLQKNENCPPIDETYCRIPPLDGASVRTTFATEAIVSVSSHESASSRINTPLSSFTSDTSYKTIDQSNVKTTDYMGSKSVGTTMRTSVDYSLDKTNVLELSLTTDDNQHPASPAAAQRSPRNSTTPTLSPSTTSSALAFWNLISIRVWAYSILHNVALN